MSSHVFAVRRLYRRVLTLHRRLPLEQKALGDQYAKDEFRRNKNASIEQAAEFLNEWKVRFRYFCAYRGFVMNVLTRLFLCAFHKFFLKLFPHEFKRICHRLQTRLHRRTRRHTAHFFLILHVASFCVSTK